jgi:hypothetical protein
VQDRQVNQRWPCAVCPPPIQLQEEVIVRGQLTAWIGDRKVVKEDFGAREYACKKSDKSIISRGATIKSATTDCIKRCAHQLGVGLHLYSKDASFRSFRLNRSEAAAQAGSNPRLSAARREPQGGSMNSVSICVPLVRPSNFRTGICRRPSQK